jgi:SAM-dependent methyltransferase
MEQEVAARKLTLALAGRSRNIAPVLARAVDLSAAKLLVDVGGGTGIYSIALLQNNPGLKAIVWDRPEVLKVTAQFASAHGVSERLECRPGDMFADPIPDVADAILLSNVLHDWDVPECMKLVARCAAALPSGGRVLIHDVLLNDAQDGPLTVALYSAALYSLTEGRGYSGADFASWLAAAGLTVAPPVHTLIHWSVITGTKA